MYDRSFLHFFSDTFTEAREKFIAAARAGDPVIRQSYLNPSHGPEGEELATEVAYFGDPSADNLLIVTSGLHGVEGWAGSACQIGWVKSRAWECLPPDVAVLVVHIINPWGMAWDRREQEDNIDLNRHFIDFSSPPDDAAFHELQPWLLDKSAPAAARQEARKQLDAFQQRHGRKAYHMALFGGQYSFPQAMAYGGRAPCWGHSMINAVFDRFAASARRIVVCDFHTGYGPYGYGIPLWHLEAGAKLEQARRLFGPTLEAPLSGDRSGDEFIQHGHFYQYCISALPHAEVIPMCFEFGGEFVSDEDGFERAIEEAAAWRDGVNDSARQAEARSLQRQVLAPAKADWREMVWFRGRQVLRELVAGISG